MATPPIHPIVWGSFVERSGGCGGVDGADEMVMGADSCRKKERKRMEEQGEGW